MAFSCFLAQLDRAGADAADETHVRAHQRGHELDFSFEAATPTKLILQQIYVHISV
jgi:hypothetical protein